MNKAASAKSNQRIFRVFISSTFNDMKAERNALQKYVFPRLRELAIAHHCRFQAIDLRWGVSSEASLDQQAMKICLSEIVRCQQTSPRPNFVILLGDRYGWKPLPCEIPSDEFNRILSNVQEEEKALLLAWYREDENALPAVYCLSPREGAYVQYETWKPVEARLHALLLRQAKGLLLDGTAMRKYFSSATEQEIAAGALDAENAHEHVVGLFRRIANLQDVIDSVKRSTEDSNSRQARDFVDVRQDGTFDDTAKAALEALKGRLRDRLPGNIYDYQAKWTQSGISTDHIGEIPRKLEQCLDINQSGRQPANLCEAVWLRLSQTIMAEAAKLEALDPLEKEIAIHRKFGEERAATFIGRIDPLDGIGKYITLGNPYPLVVWGQAGSGKSSLIAKALEQALDTKNRQTVLYRFIGLTPESSNLRTLLAGLGEQLSREYHKEESTFKPDDEHLPQKFRESLAWANAGQPLILFLDALDQLSPVEQGHSLTWLPNELPPNVHAIVSTLPGECLYAMEEKAPPENRLAVGELTKAEGKDILKEWLAMVGRKLQPVQEQAVMENFMRCRWPLYLKLIFEEARFWKSFDAPQNLSQDIPGLLRDFFDRLSRKSHGETMIARSLGYLAAAKNGLAEDELLDILSRDTMVYRSFLETSHHLPSDLIEALLRYLGPEKCKAYRLTGARPELDTLVEDWFHSNMQADEAALNNFLATVLVLEDGPRLPAVVWSRLYFDLENYLVERQADNTSLINFYHTTTFKEVIEGKYLSGAEGMRLHVALAEYFAAQPLYTGDEAANDRKLSEEPYQLSCAEQWDEFAATVTKVAWIQACVAGGRIHDLPEDIQGAIARCGQSKWKPFFESLSWAIRKEAWRLVNHPHPGLIASQLDYDLAEDRDPNSQAFLERMEVEWQAEKIPYLRLLSRPMVSHHMVLSEHSHPVAFVLATEDGNWGVSLDTDGYMLGFCPKTGAKLWAERIYTTVYDGFTLNHDGSHPSYARGAHPSKMVISDGARPQVWTASFDNTTADDFNPNWKFKCNITCLDLRTGHQIYHQIFSRGFTKDCWDDTITFKPFDMSASQDGERLILKGVDGYDAPEEAGPELILDARSGNAMKSEAQRLSLIEKKGRLLAYAGLHAAYQKNGRLVVENLTNQRMMWYKASFPDILSAAFGPNQDQLIVQTGEAQIVAVDGPEDSTPHVLLDFPTAIDHWQVSGKWLVCLAKGQLQGLYIPTGKVHVDCQVEEVEQIRFAGRTALIWLEEDRLLNLEDGKMIWLDMQASGTLYGFVQLPSQGWMGMVSQEHSLFLMSLLDLQHPTRSGAPSSRACKQQACRFSPAVFETDDDDESVAFRDDLSYAARLRRDHQIEILDRTDGRCVAQLQGRDSVCECRFEGEDYILAWGGGFFQIFDWKKGVLKYEIHDKDARGGVPPVCCDPVMFIYRGVWDGIRIVHLPTGIPIRKIKLEKELLRWFYHPHHHKLVIETKDWSRIWSTRIALLLLGSISSTLLHWAASIFFLRHSPVAGNITRESWDWNRPRFGKNGRFIDTLGGDVVTGTIEDHWLKIDRDKLEYICQASPRKAGSENDPVHDFRLSRENNAAVVIEDTGRLFRKELGNGAETEVYCRFPLEHVWTDATGCFIAALDDQENYYIFEWMGDALNVNP